MLETGHLLPPVRTLADDLRISPATVASAYKSLQNRGVLVSDGRRGTRVSQRIVIQSAPSPPLPSGVRNLRDGNPDPALLPDMAEALAQIDPSPRLYGAPRNDADLLRIAARDFKNDGLPLGPISVVNGALDGMERVLREHLRPGDRVAVEDPVFGSIVDLITALGFRAVPMQIDDDGPLPHELSRVLRSRVQAVLITSRAQNPTGAALSTTRAAELRKILQREGPDVLVVEDDHASFIAGTPAVSVIDQKMPRWSIIRSMSKALNPDLRVALITGDTTTMNRVEDRLVLGERWVSHILQRIVARLLDDRTMRKHFARVSEIYTQRRIALIDALQMHGLNAQGRSGFNVWLPVREETPVVQGLLERNWAISAGERFRIESGPAVRITTSTLDPADAVRLADDVAGLLSTRYRTAAA